MLKIKNILYKSMKKLMREKKVNVRGAYTKYYYFIWGLMWLVVDS